MINIILCVMAQLTLVFQVTVYHPLGWKGMTGITLPSVLTCIHLGTGVYNGEQTIQLLLVYSLAFIWLYSILLLIKIYKGLHKI